MQLPEDSGQSPVINIVPMIDVIFAVLTFFIVSSLFLTETTNLPITLPQATTASPQLSPSLTVTLTAQGEIFLADQPVTLDELTTAVQATQAENASILVVLRADTAASHGQVVAVLDRLSALGVQLAIATQDQ
ncbi:Putative biopolymer transport protein ExbD [Halomicronema hongdechloris C2206]|uniref:Biopolymer transport protein ExbD n=1 Tax=Halomicronema hongdechloris C2206 TaxID=1641165 RepID=A0A1Z3HSY5_9CYAN|nr:biopolymer transporter ExbD [Halomicronema hongdechloris]ASC73419.1 Putative biopolymer transport protein ExbD [Halomicronema hongdechloris C2206]